MIVYMKTELSKILKEHLEDVNLTKLAKRLGISRQLLFDWVSAGRQPTLNKLPELEKVFDYINVDL